MPRFRKACRRFRPTAPDRAIGGTSAADSEMPTFSYIARTSAGETRAGVLTAESYQAAVRSLGEQALFPVQVNEGGEASRALLGGKKRVRRAKVAEFYSQLADLLKAGVPAMRSLDVLCKQASSPVLAEVLREVREDISGGQTLADAMAKHPNAFPELHTSMVRAGERGGFLEDVLTRLASFTERQNEMNAKIIGSMAYPVILMLFCAVLVTVILTWLVPKVRSFLRGDLPAMTVFLFGLSDFLRDHWMLAAGVLASFIGGIVALVRSPHGKEIFDRIIMKTPMVGSIIRLSAICRFCRILGTLLNNGVPILQALKISRDSAGNTMLAAQIDEATEAVRKGESLAAPLASGGLFPLDVIDMIAVGEESNNLEEVLVKIADSREARLSRQMDVVVRLLEPMLLIIMAGVVGFIAIALLLPILTMGAQK